MVVSFIKTLPYDPTFGGMYSLYEGYVLSASQKTDPPIKLIKKPLCETTRATVFTSTLQRTQQTARLLYSDTFTAHCLLNEIEFNLNLLVTKNQFEQHGSRIVRKRFVEVFVQNSLSESHLDMKIRIIKLLSFLKRQNTEHIICVSHSFFMKILQSYLESNGQTFKDPYIIKKYIIPSQPTYEYGQGFEIDI
jgi:broad specificity phosphatase PhoE